MKVTETIQAWTEGPDRMDEWNFRPLECSGFWDSLFGEDWWYRWETDPSLTGFFLPLTEFLTSDAGEFWFPMFEVELTLEYVLEENPLASFGTVAGFPYGCMRSWQTKSGKWIGIMGNLEKVTIAAFDPRSLSDDSRQA